MSHALPFDAEPRGRDALADMRQFMRTEAPVILDVGANQGQSAQRFLSAFPGAVLHCFEPGASFQLLQRNLAQTPQVRLWNLALGAEAGQRLLLENDHPDMTSFLAPDQAAWGQVARRTEVTMSTVDAILAQEKLARVDLLKTDTQGFELEVFKGAEQSLAQGRIGMVYFELIFSAMYRGQPLFTEPLNFLLQRGFRLVAFYDFFYQKRLAGWADALLVHEAYVPPCCTYCD